MSTPISTLPSAQVVGWNTPDVGLQRLAANVLQVSNGSGTSEWLQQMGQVRTTTSPTNATNTPSNLTDLTVTLVAGRKYVGAMMLWANNSTAGEGLQFDLNGGGASFTSIEFGFTATPPGASLALGTLTSTAIGTALTVTTATTGDACYLIAIGCVVNAGGTLIPRFAENSAHVSGTATVKLNSWLCLFDSVN